MRREDRYLIVHDMSGILNADNCRSMGVPEGTTFEYLKAILLSIPKRKSGYSKTKNGKHIWVLPFPKKRNLILNPKVNVYEILNMEELNDYGFDEVSYKYINK